MLEIETQSIVIILQQIKIDRITINGSHNERDIE